VEVPDAAALGIEPPPQGRAAQAQPDKSLGTPSPVAVAAAAPAAVRVVEAPPSFPPPSVPAFDADDRLNLRVLEREAARLLVLGRLVLAGGILGAGIAATLPGWSPAGRVLVAGASLFAATAAWAGFRAARASCLASVALAQRQREILRSVARG
jgi:hypothetical protein